ncbi:MAG: molybdopterin-synthase adenylyltransferase MoeB [Glaciimonas sp.]|nr:molybdopterin-synthase adenylyltransferase MoeB [Glaciimonas sp.]
MNNQQLLRYSRHILLDDIDIHGQEKLLTAHALIIGAGGLGSPAALYLASAGVGTITLVDNDIVELTNLQRQILHTSDRIGQLKVQSARTALIQINPGVKVICIAERANQSRLDTLVTRADVALDCSDNFNTRHAVNRACVAHKVPLVSGAAIQFDGQISVFDPRSRSSPCYACLFPSDREFEEVQCATMGVFAPLVGIIGSMQAAEALKLIIEIGTSLAGQLLMLDTRTMEWMRINVPRDTNCQVCGKH